MSQSSAPCGGSYLLDETAETFEEAARRLKVHVSGVHRWRSPGLCGGRVRLESYLRGSRWITSAEALVRFFDRVNAIRRGEPADNGEASAPRGRTPAQRRKAAAEADRVAEAMGA